jgi:signal transduction histidine kinase
MLRVDPKFVRIVSWIAGLGAGVIGILLPFGYFVVSYRYYEWILNTQADAHASNVTRLINAHPDNWRFQQHRLEDLLKQRRAEVPEIVRIVDSGNWVVAESLVPLRAPLMVRSAELLDSGVTVGRIELVRSLRPLLFQTAVIAILAVLLACGSFVVLRVVPLRALERAMGENFKLVGTLEKQKADLIEVNQRLERQSDRLQRQVAERTAAEARLAALRDVNMAIASTLDLDTVLDILMEKIDVIFSYAAVQIWLLDKESGQLERTACRNLDEAEWKGGKLRDTPSLVKEAITTRAAMMALNVQTDPRTLNSEFYRRQGLVSYLGVPLVIKEEALGVLVFLTREEHQFTHEEIEFLSTLADQAAMAIHNSQSYAATAKLAADLARSNTELEQFAYVASHDLQEPLRMITGYTSLLAKRYRGKLDGDADEFIGYATDGAKRMHALINDLLTYSRVGTRGKEFSPTDCEAVLQATLAALRPAIEESNAVVAHDPLPTVTADATQLGQLFQNLIGNGIKYRDSKPPVIQVSSKREGSQWLFSVRDNGIGIDPKYAERIFVIFQRLHNREDYPGTGIGLTVCKKIVERHGGRIWVESQPGQGATFYFTIPA